LIDLHDTAFGSRTSVVEKGVEHDCTVASLCQLRHNRPPEVVKAPACEIGACRFHNLCVEATLEETPDGNGLSFRAGQDTAIGNFRSRLGWIGTCGHDRLTAAHQDLHG